MPKAQATKIKPNKFNEIFSTSNRFLGPARGKNPFVFKKSNGIASIEKCNLQEEKASRSTK
jgi:hypothetical protein